MENSLYHWLINLIQFLFNFDHRLYLFIVHTWLHQDWNPNLFSKTMNPTKPSLNAILLLSVVFPICFCLDTITPDQPIKDGQTLVSNRKTFALGFFSPGNSNRHYVGIWYYQITEQTVVWVANRDNPLNDISGVLSIND